jgi:hypothetical protein
VGTAVPSVVVGSTPAGSEDGATDQGKDGTTSKDTGGSHVTEDDQVEDDRVDSGDTVSVAPSDRSLSEITAGDNPSATIEVTTESVRGTAKASGTVAPNLDTKDESPLDLTCARRRIVLIFQAHNR